MTTTEQPAGPTTGTAPRQPKPPKSWAFWAWLSTGILAAGYILGLAVIYFVQHGPLFKAGEGYSGFTAIFVLTLALERLLNPFTSYLGDDVDAAKADVAKKKAAASATTAGPDKTAASEALPKASETLDKARQSTALVTWGVASALGFLMAAGLNVLLLSSVTAGGQPPKWLDLLVTGLVLGAGTKPVHDLVSRIETAKEQASDDKAAADAKP